MKAQAHSDEVLFAEVTSGKLTAWQSLFERHHARVHACLRFYGLSPAAAEELTISIFERVWQTWADLPHDIRPRAHIARILRELMQERADQAGRSRPASL